MTRKSRQSRMKCPLCGGQMYFRVKKGEFRCLKCKAIIA